MAAPTPLTHHDALPAGTRLHEFEIEKVVGVGGFGIVYRALDHALERVVALKEYLPGSLAGRGVGHEVSIRSTSHVETFGVGMRSFVNEARLLARFDHPGLLKVYRFWEDNNTAYMVMPFYEGKTLAATRRAMTHPPDEAWMRALLGPVLGALEVMHNEQVYHRDVAPDNIILRADGTPVLLDFGAARRVIGDRTQTLTAIIKPNFAPIEQYSETTQLRQGPWTDVYALAAVVYYCALGRPPVPASARAVIDEVVPLPQVVGSVGCDWSERFAQIWHSAMALRPADRPQSIAQLRAMLDADAPLLPSATAYLAAAGGTSDNFAQTVVATAAPSRLPTTAALQGDAVLGVQPMEPVHSPTMVVGKTGALASEPVAGSAALVPTPQQPQPLVPMSTRADATAPAARGVPPAGALAAGRSSVNPATNADFAATMAPRRAKEHRAAESRSAPRMPRAWAWALIVAAPVVLTGVAWWALRAPLQSRPETVAVPPLPAVAERINGVAVPGITGAAAVVVPAEPTRVTRPAIDPQLRAGAGAKIAVLPPSQPLPAQLPIEEFLTEDGKVEPAAKLPVRPPQGAAGTAAPTPARAVTAAGSAKPRPGSAGELPALVIGAPPPPQGPRPTTTAAPNGAAPALETPRNTCGGRVFVALYRCMQRQCARPQLTDHPQCVEWRKQEEGARGPR